MSADHPSIARSREEHQRRGGAGEVVIVPDPALAAAPAAEEPGRPVRAVTGSLPLAADGSRRR